MVYIESPPARCPTNTPLSTADTITMTSTPTARPASAHGPTPSASLGPLPAPIVGGSSPCASRTPGKSPTYMRKVSPEGRAAGRRAWNCSSRPTSASPARAVAVASPSKPTDGSDPHRQAQMAFAKRYRLCGRTSRPASAASFRDLQRLRDCAAARFNVTSPFVKTVPPRASAQRPMSAPQIGVLASLSTPLSAIVNDDARLLPWEATPSAPAAFRPDGLPTRIADYPGNSPPRNKDGILDRFHAGAAGRNVVCSPKRKIKVKEVRAKLDALSAPTTRQLRVNFQNAKATYNIPVSPEKNKTATGTGQLTAEEKLQANIREQLARSTSPRSLQRALDAANRICEKSEADSRPDLATRLSTPTIIDDEGAFNETGVLKAALKIAHVGDEAEPEADILLDGDALDAISAVSPIAGARLNSLSRKNTNEGTIVSEQHGNDAKRINKLWSKAKTVVLINQLQVSASKPVTDGQTVNIAQIVRAETTRRLQELSGKPAKATVKFEDEEEEDPEQVVERDLKNFFKQSASSKTRRTRLIVQTALSEVAKTRMSKAHVMFSEEAPQAEEPDSPCGLASANEEQRRWIQLFHYLKHDGEVHRDHLVRALQLSNFPFPVGKTREEREEEITQRLENITQYRSVELSEFVRFMDVTEEDHFAALQAHLTESKADPDKPIDDVFAPGTISAEELVVLLEKCGHVVLDLPLKEALSDVTTKSLERVTMEDARKTLQILRLRCGFTRRELRHYKRLFTMLSHKSESCKEGSVSTDELPIACRWLGHQIDTEDIERILEEVIKQDGHELMEQEFLTFLRLMRAEELGSLHRVSKTVSLKPDDDNTHIAGMRKILRELGFTPSWESVRHAAQDAGLEAPDVVRTDTAGSVKAESRLAATAKQGAMTLRRSMALRKSLRSSADLTPAPDEEERPMSQLFRLVEKYREREGLSRHEMEEIDASFRRYDRDGTGTIVALDVGKLLRWLGYATNFDVQTGLVEMVDFDRSGKLTLQDTRKLIRLFRENEIVKIKDVFREHDSEGNGILSGPMCRRAIQQLGFTKVSRSYVYGTIGGPTSDSEDEASPSGRSGVLRERSGALNQVAAKFKSTRGSLVDLRKGLASRAQHAKKIVGGVDLWHFVDLVCRLQEEKRAKFRDNAGFTDDEVFDMRTRFEKYDTDRSGNIDNAELRLLLEDLFPVLSTSPKLRPYLLRLLMEVDENSDGQLDFPDFMRLMRQVHDLQELDRHEREAALIEEKRFTHEEVDEFRDLFLGGVPDRTVVSLPQVVNMLGVFLPMDQAHLQQLSQIFHEVVQTSEGAGHLSRGCAEADFPDFLIFMHKILDLNFDNITEYASRAAAAKEKEEAAARAASK